MDELKWIEFNERLIRIRDIDFIELSHHNSEIICHYHLGISYETMKENFDSTADQIERFSELSKMLGVENHEKHYL